MQLIDLIKVMTTDSEIIIYDIKQGEFLAVGKVCDVMINGEVPEEDLHKLVTKVYYSNAYTGIMIDVE